jgi:hypothetical protein
MWRCKSPPHAWGPMKLLWCKQCLLKLNAVKQSKLWLNHSKPMVSFKRIRHLDKFWRLCCQEVKVGGLLRLLMRLWLSCLALINCYQLLHDGIQQCQQLFEAHRRCQWRGWRHKWTECPTTMGWGLRDIIIHALAWGSSHHLSQGSSYYRKV